MFWSKEDEVKLKQYVNQGLTYLQISKLLNKSKNAVLGKANRLNLVYVALRKREKKKIPLEFVPYVPLVLPDAPKSRELTIDQLEKNDCRYIAGTDRKFCGHETVENSSYCKYHKVVCCIPTPPLYVGD